jgi:hypothetical protein
MPHASRRAHRIEVLEYLADETAHHDGNGSLWLYENDAGVEFSARELAWRKEVVQSVAKQLRARAARLKASKQRRR